MAKLTGKIALVTGAATGIGEASSRLLAQEGARVILPDIYPNDDLARQSMNEVSILITRREG